MIYIIASVLLLAVFHFVYESIIAPSMRLELKHRLFALRDRLRRLKLAARDDLDDRHFHYLQDSINGLIRALDHLDLALLHRLRSARLHDATLTSRVDSRSRILDECRIPEAVEIRGKTFRIAIEALAVNSGAWIVYLVPLLVAAAGYAEVKRLIGSVISMPPPDLLRLASRVSPRANA